MAVRFTSNAEAPPEAAPQRDNLAEVIELRSKLVATVDAPIEETDDAHPRAEGTRLLARRAMSSGELHDALVKQGHDRHEVEDVIDEFEQACYLDDVGLARATAEKLRESKHASRFQIRAKLKERKLPDAIVAEVLDAMSDEEEHELLRATAEKRARNLAGLDRQTAERRLLGYLQRRGWQGEATFRVVREVLAP